MYIVTNLMLSATANQYWILGVKQQKSDGQVKSDKCLFQTFWRLLSKLTPCPTLHVRSTFADSPLSIPNN